MHSKMNAQSIGFWGSKPARGKNQIQDNKRDGKKQVKNLAAEIGRFVIPMPNDFGNIRIIVRATKIGDGTVVVKPKIAATAA